VASAVKRIAVEESLAVFQPEKPREAGFIDAIRACAPDISVVVAYGHLLPKDVIDLPRLGTLNIHASLLPAWRGAAPIQAAIREGDAETGVTIMRMVPKLDAGPILLQVPTPIVHDETYGELQLRLSELGALALIEALSLIDIGQMVEREQDESLATFAPKIEREHARIDWTRPAAEVARSIRAYDPKPGAWTMLGGVEVKLFGARGTAADRPTGAEDASPGAVIAVEESGAIIACGDGVVRITDAQPAGKRRLTMTELSRGRGIGVGHRFDS
jgi:methionyl-tRNA formyltransferase